jgi:hypothetical protein
MDGPGRRPPSGVAKRRSGGARLEPVERQTELRRAHPGGTVLAMFIAVTARLWLGSTNISRGLPLDCPAATRACASGL